MEEMASLLLAGLGGLVLGQFKPVSDLIAYFGRRTVERTGEKEIRNEARELLEVHAAMVRQDATIDDLAHLQEEIARLRTYPAPEGAGGVPLEEVKFLISAVKELTARNWWWISYLSAREAGMSRTAQQLSSTITELLRLRETDEEVIATQEETHELIATWWQEPAAVFYYAAEKFLECEGDYEHLKPTDLERLQAIVPRPPDYPEYHRTMSG